MTAQLSRLSARLAHMEIESTPPEPAGATCCSTLCNIAFTVDYTEKIILARSNDGAGNNVPRATERAPRVGVAQVDRSSDVPFHHHIASRRKLSRYPDFRALNPEYRNTSAPSIVPYSRRPGTQSRRTAPAVDIYLLATS